MIERSTTRPTTRLREYLNQDGPVFMPGCYDALSARMIEQAGFPAAAISGFAVETALLGGPDIGLMSLTELAAQASHITRTVDIPVITDVDTGFGGVQNIFRTVRTIEQAGLAGLHLEDQALPKRCPVLPGRKLVSISEAANRYAVALEARTDPDFVVIARTDADSLSYDHQVERANRYLEVGVDAVLPMLIEYNGKSFYGFSPERQMEIVAQTVQDIDGPVMYVGDPPRGYTQKDMGDAGVKIMSASAITLEAAATAMREVLGALRDTGSAAQFYDRHPDKVSAGMELMKIMHVDHYLDLDTRFSVG